MAEKMTPKGLLIGLIVDQKETKKGKGKPYKPTNESSKQNDFSEQAEKTEE